ncbi:hypothetical protein CB1_000125020 [Camelus ferus]|nr:hypothetical protein CB1_000125020 [Camelus ferus]
MPPELPGCSAGGWASPARWSGVRTFKALIMVPSPALLPRFGFEELGTRLIRKDTLFQVKGLKCLPVWSAARACSGVWDNITCWRPADVGETVTVPCPKLFSNLYSKPAPASELPPQAPGAGAEWIRGPPAPSTQCPESVTTSVGTCHALHFTRLSSEQVNKVGERRAGQEGGCGVMGFGSRCRSFDSTFLEEAEEGGHAVQLGVQMGLSLTPEEEVSQDRAGNISKNCTSDGWSETFPDFMDACGYSDSEDESKVGAAAEDVGHPWAGSPVEAALTLPANTGVPP